MKVKYQITMEVEVEVDNLNDKKTNKIVVEQLADSVTMGLKSRAIVTVNKVEVSRIGATGITPRVVKGKIHCTNCGTNWFPTGDDQFHIQKGWTIQCPKCGCEITKEDYQIV